MSNDNIQLIQYVYMDIVSFTKNRTVETQALLIENLNVIVKAVVSQMQLVQSGYLFLPTGDGLAVAIIQPKHFDVGVMFGLAMIESIGEYNNQQTEEAKKFQVRIGVNQNIDNIIFDINDNKNVAGRGINQAHRLMMCADGMQIIIGNSVFEYLREREDYLESFVRFSATDKHGNNFDAYQYVSKVVDALNTSTPSRFSRGKSVEPEMTQIVACFILLADACKFFFSTKQKATYFVRNGNILVYVMGMDLDACVSSGPHDSIYRFVSDLEKDWNTLDESHSGAAMYFDMYLNDFISKYRKYFEVIDRETAFFLPKAFAIDEAKAKFPHLSAKLSRYLSEVTGVG